MENNELAKKLLVGELENIDSYFFLPLGKPEIIDKKISFAMSGFDEEDIFYTIDIPIEIEGENKQVIEGGNLGYVFTDWHIDHQNAHRNIEGQKIISNDYVIHIDELTRAGIKNITYEEEKIYSENPFSRTPYTINVKMKAKVSIIAKESIARIIFSNVKKLFYIPDRLINAK